MNILEMRKVFLIPIMVLGSLGILALGFAMYAWLFPWDLSIHNTNCSPIEIPQINIMGADMFRLVGGHNPIKTTELSHFQMPGSPFPITLIGDGTLYPDTVVISAIVSNTLETRDFQLDVTPYSSFQINEKEMIGQGQTQFPLDGRSVRIVLVCK